MRHFMIVLSLFCAGGLLVQSASAQIGEPKVGLGFNISSLGIGVQGAYRLGESTDVRLGFNDFNYGHSLNRDGINYAGRLDLRSARAAFDWYVWGPLHISPGVMLYNDNRATATALAPGGQQFTLGGTTYTSSSAAPVTGTGLLNLSKSGPMLTIGLGNMVPTGRFNMEAEVGAVYQGSPAVTLNLNGTVCDSTGTVCGPTSSFPGFAASVQQEQSTLNHDLRFFKIYPIASIGFAVSF